MDLKDILSISGYSGLFKYISQARNGIIVEGLEDKKRMIALSHYRVVSLNDIAIYTEIDELPLRKIFKTIYEKEQGGQVSSENLEDKKIKNYFEQIVPQYHVQKVHVSDMKKVIRWYNILVRNGFTQFEENENEEANTTEGNVEENKA